jgi:hypothetical protein
MSDADIMLKHGEKYPYNHRPPKDWAERAALGVLADLSDRRGIKWALQEIKGDEDISEEIVVSLAAIIRRAHPTTAEGGPVER